jgi:hypothetical protein
VFLKSSLIQVFLTVALGFFVAAPARFSFAQSTCAPLLPRDVCELENQIYTQTDFKKTEDVRAVMLGLKALFMAHVNDSVVVQDHLVGLTEHVLEAAFEARAPREILGAADGQPHLLKIHDRLMKYEKEHGPIVPLDWRAPENLFYLVPAVTRVYNPVKDRTYFNFDVFAVAKEENSVEQLQLIRYPNEVIMDRKAGIGIWDEGHLAPNSWPNFTLGTYNLPKAPKDGLYLLNIKARNQPMIHGWFILTRATSSANPTIQAPSPNEKLHTSDPMFRLADFTSPEFKPFQMKKRILKIWQRNTEDDKSVWSSAQVGPVASAVTVSEAPNRTGVSSLENGSYALKASYQERWFFGDLLIGRHSTTEVPFKIAK